ncbi:MULTISPECIES: GNAT family N-acetyltransferase [Bacillaceae]|uniref:GNAT family N-acetyltransferase n=1 Tax=Evansella alkalicola TaxID=745819 RepID=A0ABS6JYJ7_9BACI|nr:MULTISPECIES: GNAT family protein [Bacillaceae]MBU9722729.1 GNAT family N-acetyltransferase [Bacillus alkalicola]
MFLESKLLRLRYTSENDLDFVCKLESDKDNAKYILPWSLVKHEKALDDEDILHLVMEERVSNRLIGYMIIAGLQNPNKSLEFVRITIGDKGKGYGKEGFKVIKNWAFKEFGAHRLWLDVKVNNQRAYNLYKKEGFFVEGTLRECIKGDDGYESLHVMSLLKSEYYEEADY